MEKHTLYMSTLSYITILGELCGSANAFDYYFNNGTIQESYLTKKYLNQGYS